MVVTLPLPTRITQYFPQRMVWFLQWFAFYTFAALLIVPWTFCVFRLVTTTIGRSKRIKEVLHDRIAPKVVIVMPVYNEDPPILIKAIDSVVDCDYPPSCIHVFLSFDGEPNDTLWDQVAEKLEIPPGIRNKAKSIDVIYKSARITVSRFPHGGKRHCQKQAFKLIDSIYTQYLARHDDLFVLFIDSDCILDKVCLQNFMYDMELKPGSTHDMLAMTGVITSTTEKNSLITILQDMEYIHGQLFERSVESSCGAVTCLPGALTMLRFSAFRKMAKYYFEDQIDKIDDFFDYIKCHLGEDRWLTHLFMVSTVRGYQIQMCTSAFCKTEAVQTMHSLIKQRRRWFLGFISNEVCMLTDVRIWRRYPILCVIRFMQNTIRTTALLFFIMVISVLTTSNKITSLPVGFIAVSLGLNYLLMLYFGFVLKRFKAWLYPLMFLLNPFFNWMYLVYGCCTAGKRTWGGPRTDAPKADENTSPREAAEKAAAQGDDLNVDISTFREYGNAVEGIPLHPSDTIEGRFAAGQSTAEAYYDGQYEANMSLEPLNPVPRISLHPRASFDSTMTGSNSVFMPRQVESLMDEEEQRKLQYIRHSQRVSSFFNDDTDRGTGSSGVKSSPRNSMSSVDRLNWSPHPSPPLSGIPHVEDAYVPESPRPDAHHDPLRQLQTLHLTPSPLGRSSPQRPSLDGDEVKSRTSLAESSAKHSSHSSPGKPEKKRRRLMKFGKWPGDQA
jgi:chitin synthase